jgi:type II secretory pathway pseudopilin PulG
VEVLVSNALLGLLFLGAVTLFVASAEQAVKSDAAGSAATGAANGLEHVTEDAREALWCALPDDANGDFTSPPGASAAGYQAGGVDTGVELAFPGTLTESVQDTGPHTATTYNRADPAGGTLWVYRADAGGASDPQAGTLLWVQGTEWGQPVNHAIMTGVAAGAGSVAFQRPTDAAGTPLPYQLQIKLVGAAYSLIGGVQSSEATDGTAVTLTVGRCTLFRDHEPGLSHEPIPAGSSGGANATLSN